MLAGRCRPERAAGVFGIYFSGVILLAVLPLLFCSRREGEGRRGWPPGQGRSRFNARFHIAIRMQAQLELSGSIERQWAVTLLR
jgi:hypothetical protein